MTIEIQDWLLVIVIVFSYVFGIATIIVVNKKKIIKLTVKKNDGTYWGMCEHEKFIIEHADSLEQLKDKVRSRFNEMNIEFELIQL